MGAAQAKSATNEVTISDEQRNKELNMYTIAPEGFMCKNNISKDNNIPTITNIIIYFLILFIILFIILFMSYLLYNGIIK